MPTPRSWFQWLAAVPALLLCAEAAAQGRPLPPCAGTQQERWHECVGAFEDRRSGVTYHGEFRNGTMHGVGVLRTPVTTYAGDFSEGRMHGQGVLTMLEDRRQYSGGFRNGLMHGSGSIVAADGRVLATGRFQDGAFAAPSTPPSSSAPAAASAVARAGLGATLGEPGPGRPSGAVVTDVTAGSAARRGGLAPGDVVVGLGGWRVSRPADLEAAVNAIEQDGVVMLRLLRNGIEMELAVPLAAVNPAPAAGMPPTPAARAQAPGGAGLSTSTADPPRAGATTTSTMAVAPAAGTTVTTAGTAGAGKPGTTVTSTAAAATGPAAMTTSTGTVGTAGTTTAAAAMAAVPPAPARSPAAASPAPSSAPATPAAAPTIAPPQGLYLVRQGQVSLAELDVWYFSGGFVAQSPRAASAGAPAAFDFARAEAQRPGSTAAFTLDGARMMLSGPALPLTAARVDPAASGCFRWKEGLYCPAPRFAAGARLDGVFANPSAPGGTVARAAFKIDGSYEIARATANRGAPPARERGRYEIDGNVLRLRPAGGGAPAALTVVPYDDGTPGPAPRRLFLGGTVLGRQ
jgi:hypothetical protein